ncbi:alpha/beta hydrolase [Roseovarius tibetensis]|uniref:alpha/beta hydrolase n=1 Tax=Roseovarius tibetensis TaxID=2685897 RepID=UPI003D7F45DF
MRLVEHVIWICALVLLSACGRPVTFSQLSEGDAERSEAFYYVTDRASQRSQDGGIAYTTERSPAMTFGVAQIATDTVRPDLEGLHEIRRFPQTPLPFSQDRGIILPDAEATLAYNAAKADMRRTLASALQRSGQREILFYVHGFNSLFEETLETTARLWHVTGRDALPVAYSWPAGNPGAFGYFKDRESGEFSVFHLKETLRLLKDVPGLERIHIVAHSRGSDVVTTALRELVIEERAAGRNPLQTLKVETLILAAPDLDFSVVRQRLIAEHFGPAFGRITVYMNPNDGALGLAQLLMAGTRFGRLSFDALGETEREIFRRIRNVHFVNVSAVTGQSSHSYFRNNPEVLADLAKVITTGTPPESPSRNLEPLEANFWRLILPPDPAPRTSPIDR